MEQVIKDCGEDAKIAIMTGTLGQDTTNQICGGYDAVLEKYPNVEVVFEGAGNWGATVLRLWQKTGWLQEKKLTQSSATMMEWLSE